MEAISLYELNNRIKQTLKASFADSVWITAEITEVQLNRRPDLYHRGSGTEKERNPGSARGRRGNRYEPGTGIPGIA